MKERHVHIGKKTTKYAVMMMVFDYVVPKKKSYFKFKGDRLTLFTSNLFLTEDLFKFL